MSFQFWINPTPKISQRLLPGVEHCSLVPLWILPEEKQFSANMLKSVVASVTGRRCALWQLSSNTTHSNHMQYRAFAKRPNLIDDFLVQNQSTYSQLVKSLAFRFSQTVYSDVAWLADEQWELFSDFTSESRFGIDSSMAFLPLDLAKAQIWGNIVVGYLWLALNDRFRYNTNTPVLPADSIILAILKMSAESDCIPVTICRDSDMRKAMMLWGSVEQIQDVAKKLSLIGMAGDELTFNRWANRGIDLVA